jgi:hypothetical protein
MRLHLEIVRHAAAAVDAVPERDRFQVAAQVIAPGVIDAVEIFDFPTIVETDQRAAMRASVLERDDLAILGASHHDRHRAHHGGAVLAGLRHVDLQTEKVPGRTFKHTRLFIARDLRIAIHPIRNTGQAGGPGTGRKIAHRLIHVTLRELSEFRRRSA